MSGIDVGWGFVGLLMTLMGWLSLSLKFHRRGGSAVGVVPIRLARELMYLDSFRGTQCMYQVDTFVHDMEVGLFTQS